MRSAPPVEFRLVPQTEILVPQKAAMFRLLTEHFDGVTPERFARDLAEKSLALLIERGDQLVGFSTLLSWSTKFEDTPLNVIYSGDTIMSPQAWGTTALPRAWVAGVESLRAGLPEGRCFWLLLTSGFRTYRFLPVFWKEFFPRFDVATPGTLQRLLAKLGSERFGSEFDAANGIVRFQNPQRLRAGLKEIPEGRDGDPHVSFFLSRNPRHADGDELVCLTELHPDNLTAAGRRMTHRPAYAL